MAELHTFTMLTHGPCHATHCSTWQRFLTRLIASYVLVFNNKVRECGMGSIYRVATERIVTGMRRQPSRRLRRSCWT